MSNRMPRPSAAVMKQAIFRPRSAIIIGLTIISAFVVAAYWWLIIGLGLVAWLISAWETTRNPHIQALALSYEQEFKAKEIAAELEKWWQSVKDRLPADIVAKVASIKKSILEILPHIENISSSEYNVYIIRQIAQSYLPETIANYLKLPPDYATTKQLRDGNTPHEVLLTQLDLLDREMKDLLEDFYQNDTQRLLAHGRFLKDKFGTSDLLDV